MGVMMILAIYYYPPTLFHVAAPSSRGNIQKPQPVCGFTYVTKCCDIIVYSCTFKFIGSHTAYEVCHDYVDRVHGYSLG